MSVGVIVACIALLGGAIFGGVADAKKKKVKTATVSNKTPRLIPDAQAGSATTPATYGKLATPLTVSKKFKGTVGDVSLTLQTTGVTPTAANDLFFRVTAPNGRTVGVDPGNLTGQSIGPLTITANSPIGTCGGSATPPPPPCNDPDNSLNAPYVGTAGDVGLSFFEGVKMKGTWTVSVFDDNNLDTSVLNSVSLKITPAPTTTSTK